MLNGLLFISGASIGYALHSTIVTGEFDQLFVTGLGTLGVWMALRWRGDETADGAAEVDG